MKSIVVLVAFILAAGAAHAQIVSEEFEQWDSTVDRSLPPGWGGGPFGSGKAERAYSGNFAASVWNWYFYAKGYLITGRQDVSPWDLDRAGVPISFKPTRLSGFYRFLTGDNGGRNDSAVVTVMLKKYDQMRGAFDTIALATRRLGPVESYTQFFVDLPDRAPGVLPDSIVIMLMSSDSGFCGPTSDGNCCYLSVDDLQLSAASGVTYNADALFTTASVYPNPVRSTARIEWKGASSRPHRLRVFSIAGKLIATMEGLTEGSALLHRASFIPGEYLFEVCDEANAVAARGRFVVE